MPSPKRHPTPSPTCVTAWLVVWGLLLVGCRPTATPPPDPEALDLESRFGPAPQAAVVETPPPPEAESGQQDWLAPDKLPWEAWYLQYLSGRKIGYSHVLVEKPQLHYIDRIRVRRTDVIELVQDGVPTRFERMLDAAETRDGQLLNLTDTARVGDQLTVTQGTVRDGVLTLTTTVGDQPPSRVDLPWKAGTWGILGVQAILMQTPPKAGEALTANIFLPQLKQIAAVGLVAGKPDLTSLPGGETQTLLPIEIELRTQETALRSRNWINERGEIMKTISLSGPSLSTFRAPAVLAHRTRDEFALTAFLGSSVPLSGYVPQADPQNAVYEVERQPAIEETSEVTTDLDEVVDRPELFYAFVASDQQSLKSTGALDLEITVGANAEPPPQPAALTDELLAAYRQPSPLIPADHPYLAELASQWAGGKPGEHQDVRQVALALTAEVHQNTRLQPFEGKFESPLQTARQQTGDAGEQALLLTALLRHHGIPARVASGLRIDPADTSRMIFHMWTEARLDDSWLALDATQGGPAGVDRLKMLDSPLDSENPYSAVLPVYRAMEQTTVQLKSYE